MRPGIFVDLGCINPDLTIEAVSNSLCPDGYILTVENMLSLSLMDAILHARNRDEKIAFKVPTTSSLLLHDLLPLAVALGADPIIFPSVRGLGRNNQDRFLNELQKCRELIRTACNIHQIPAPKIWLDEAVLRPVIEPNYARGLGFDGYVMLGQAVRFDRKRKGHDEFQIVGYCGDEVSPKMCLENVADAIVKVHTVEQCATFYRVWYHSS